MIFRRSLLGLALLMSLLTAGTAADAATAEVSVNLRPNGSLTITGTNGNDNIVVCQDPEALEDFAVIIRAGDSFIVKTASGVTGDVRINMRSGSDQLQLNGAANPPADCDDVYPPMPPGIGGDTCAADDHCHHEPEMLFPRNLRINMGGGVNDRFVRGYEFGVVEDLSIVGATDVSLDYVNVWDRASIIGNSNRETGVFIEDSYFGRINIRTRGGEDRVWIENTDLGVRPFISTAAGADNITVRFPVIDGPGRATVNSGSGEDQVLWLDLSEERDYLLNLIMGAHNDRLDLFGPLMAGDRANGGSGNMDTLRTLPNEDPPPGGGPSINGFELFEEIEL